MNPQTRKNPWYEHPLSVKIFKNSPIGIYLRTCILEIEQMDFEGIIKLLNDAKNTPNQHTILDVSYVDKLVIGLEGSQLCQ